MDDWDISDETMAALRGERVTVTFDVAELVPGTYVYLDADDEVLAIGALDDDRHRGVPPALAEFLDNDDDDTDPNGKTIVGPPMTPRSPAPRPAGGDGNDDPDGRTTVGPLMRPRRPAPRRK